MKKAKLFSINYRDFFKGAIVAVGTALFATLAMLLQTGQIFKKEGLLIILTATGSAFCGYVGKNFFTNSKDEFATPETLPQP
jgi:hypothetical protein